MQKLYSKQTWIQISIVSQLKHFQIHSINYVIMELRLKFKLLHVMIKLIARDKMHKFQHIKQFN